MYTHILYPHFFFLDAHSTDPELLYNLADFICRGKGLFDSSPPFQGDGRITPVYQACLPMSVSRVRFL